MQGRAEEDNRRARAIKGRKEFRLFRQGMTDIRVLFPFVFVFPVLKRQKKYNRKTFWERCTITYPPPSPCYATIREFESKEYP